MSAFTMRTTVRCPLDQASRRIAQYFATHGNPDGDTVRFELLVDVPLNVIATIGPMNDAEDDGGSRMFPAYRIVWIAERNGPFPAFAGTLAVEADDTIATFVLSLTGDYEVPLGAVGAAFDALVGRRVAKATISHLLARIANEIEERRLADERIALTRRA